MLFPSKPSLDPFSSENDFELFSFTDYFSVLILRFKLFHVFFLDLVG